jgi:hypothetical protein
MELERRSCHSSFVIGRITGGKAMIGGSPFSCYIQRANKG